MYLVSTNTSTCKQVQILIHKYKVCIHKHITSTHTKHTECTVQCDTVRLCRPHLISYGAVLCKESSRKKNKQRKKMEEEVLSVHRSVSLSPFFSPCPCLTSLHPLFLGFFPQLLLLLQRFLFLHSHSCSLAPVLSRLVSLCFLSLCL